MSGVDDELELAILLLADRLNRMTSTLRESKARLRDVERRANDLLARQWDRQNPDLLATEAQLAPLYPPEDTP